MQEQLFSSQNIEEKYIPLARKYRPRLFKDVVEQGHVITIITNSIRNNKLHHAYLLTGIRGIGKTTFARLFAKAKPVFSFNLIRLYAFFSLHAEYQ